MTLELGLYMPKVPGLPREAFVKFTEPKLVEVLISAGFGRSDAERAIEALRRAVDYAARRK